MFQRLKKKKQSLKKGNLLRLLQKVHGRGVVK